VGEKVESTKGIFVCVLDAREHHTASQPKKEKVYRTNGINPIKRVANNERISLCAGARIGGGKYYSTHTL